METLSKISLFSVQILLTFYNQNDQDFERNKEQLFQTRYSKLANELNEENMYEFAVLKRISNISPSDEILQVCYKSLKDPLLINIFKDLLDHTNSQYTTL
jgi:hypothetical protein